MRWLGLLFVLNLPVVASGDEVDPFEPLNRKIYSFNTAVDKWTLKPLAKAYTTVTPEPVRNSFSNFFENLNTPGIAINQFLQGKPKDGFSDTGRFLINTTVGIGGLFDVASKVGLAEHEEDFGQTFARWGIGDGPYLMIPLRGPGTIRHATGMFFDALTNPLRLIDHVPTRNTAYGMYTLDLRANLLGAESLLSGDEYLFLRDAYFQRRDFLVNDGEVEDPFLDDFDDF